MKMRNNIKFEYEVRRGWYKSYLNKYGEERFIESFPIFHAYLKKTGRIKDTACKSRP